MMNRKENNIDNSDSQKFNPIDWVEIFVIILIICSAFAVVIMAIKHNFISDQGLVIGFFGILATIVVLGNYTQVESIRHETEREIDNMQQNVADIEKVKKDFYVEGRPRLDLYSKEEIDKLISKEVGERMLTQVKLIEQNVDKLYDYCVGDNYKDFIDSVVKRKERKQCIIRRKDNNQRRIAWAKFIDNKIVFRDKNDGEFKDVVKVNDIAYDEERMNRLATLWNNVHHSNYPTEEIEVNMNDAEDTLYGAKKAQAQEPKQE